MAAIRRGHVRVAMLGDRSAMWCLQGFDRATEALVQEIALARADANIIRRELNIDDDLPVEPFDFDVATIAAARKLAAYGDEGVDVDPRLLYQLAFYADPQ
ncbi:DUF7683 domain-containing protein [Mycobacteroides abscessus]|uniref:DUF7683 domain-containing protein n=1 Tax=Mycobacteroides abscessus TaxID=36809 RepID=UPI0010545FFD|nr:hypothetical protein [Mycobacteroides abscessus]